MGGAENLLLQLVQRLDPSRYRSVVCCINNKGDIGKQIETLGIPVHELGLLKKGGFDRTIIKKLCGILEKGNVDLIHTHLYHANLYGRLAARRTGIPAVASVHNTYAKPRWHRHLLNRWLARGTAFVTVGSEQVLEDVRRLDKIPEHKLVLIPNAVDTGAVSSLSKEEARSRLGFQPEDFVIGTVGRLEEQKGHKFLVEAAEHLVKECPRLRVLIVGEGRLRPALEEQIQTLKLQNVVSLPGQRSDLPDIFAALDLFVMPSLWEGLALAMLSAMTAGLPVVATDVGGVQKALDGGQAGTIVPPGDTAALVEGIQKAISQPEASLVKSRAGKERVKKLYSIESLVRQVAGLYEKALATSP